MPISIEEMMADLEAADAQGDTELAQHIAAQIKAAQGQAPAAPTLAPASAPPGGGLPAPPSPAPAPPAIGVPGPAAAPPGPAPGAPAAGPIITMPEQYDPSEGLNSLAPAGIEALRFPIPEGVGKFLAGAGQATASTGHGIRQLWNMATGDTEELGRLMQEEEDRRQLDAPLLRTGAGRAGQIAGHIAQAAIPVGLGAKAATTAGKLGLNVALGAGHAALAPTVKGESHGRNAAVGGATSLLLPAGSKLVGLVSSAKGAALRGIAKAIGLGGPGAVDAKAEAIREAARGQISTIMGKVKVPLAPLKSEFEAIKRTYGADLPKSIRAGLDEYVDLANSGGKLLGSRLAEARTTLLRETGKAAVRKKAGSGAAQTGMERLRRTLDNATDEALDRMPKTLRQRLFGSDVTKLRAARAQYKSGTKPDSATLAPYKRAATRATVEALRRPGPSYKEK